MAPYYTTSTGDIQEGGRLPSPGPQTSLASATSTFIGSVNASMMGEAQVPELAASTRRTRNAREEVSQRKWQSPCQKRNQDKYSRRPHTKTTQPFMLHEIGFKKEQSQNFLQNVFYFRFKEQGRGSQTRASCPISYFPNCIFSEKACLWSNQELCQATTKMVCFPI